MKHRQIIVAQDIIRQSEATKGSPLKYQTGIEELVSRGDSSIEVSVSSE